MLVRVELNISNKKGTILSQVRFPEDIDWRSTGASMITLLYIILYRGTCLPYSRSKHTASSKLYISKNSKSSEQLPDLGPISTHLYWNQLLLTKQKSYLEQNYLLNQIKDTFMP